MNYKMLTGVTLAIVLSAGSGIWLFAQRPGPLRPSQLMGVLPQPGQSQTGQPLQNSYPHEVATMPTVGAPVPTPNLISANTPTSVMVSVYIVPDPIPNSVNLLRLGGKGVQPMSLGVMQSAGNGLYTLQIPLTEPLGGQVQIQASAAFRGLLKRVVSQSASILVWKAAQFQRVGISMLYPPELTPRVVTGSTPTIVLESTSRPLFLGGRLPQGSNFSDFADEGYAITISSEPYSDSFDVSSWVLSNRPHSSVASVSSLVIQPGVTGYRIIFSDELFAGQPLILIPYKGRLYKVTYRSTFDAGSAQEVAGVATFEKILSTLTLD